jgi:hypothetical protein
MLLNCIEITFNKLKIVMKKTLLSFLALGTWFYAGAQNASKVELTPAKPIHISQTKTHTTLKNDASTSHGQAVSIPVTRVKKAQGSGPVHCGSAYNLYGVLDASTTAVTYDSATHAILFTHREDDSKFATGGSGAYEASYSLDGGATWDTSLVMFSNVSTRYPNGVLYNPAGNTVFTNAYWVTNGPIAGAATTDVWTGWDSIAFGTMKLDGSGVTQTYKANGKPGVLVEEGVQYMSIGSDGVVHSIGDGDHSTGTSGYSFLGSSLNTGTFSAGSFTWNQTLIRPHLMPSDHVSTQFDTIPELMTVSGTAWSQDGIVGYVVYFGNLDSTDAVSHQNLNFTTSQPIVYKTTNSGASWSMMTPHNFRNDPAIVAHLHPTSDSPSVVMPLFRLFHNAGAQGGEDDYDLVVDKNKNLHIFAGITAGGRANNDSSNYYFFFNPEIDFLYDFSTTTSGGWNARYIDTLYKAPLQYATLNSTTGFNSDGSGTVAIGHRIQASRTTDGSKIFVNWLDDVITAASTDSLQFPDMFGQGFDVTNSYITPNKQFTQSGDRYFTCVSDKPIVSGTSGHYTYKIPVVRVEPPTLANDGLNPVYFLYDTTAVFYDNDFSVDGIAQINAPQFSISANYPNPYKGITRFDVNMVKEGVVNVNVYNMVGQKMMTLSPEKLGVGSHTISINANGFSAGVYFYQVTVDGTSLTQKMIIE